MSSHEPSQNSLTFPWPFCGFPWPWDILSAFHYCLNINFASNLTNHSPKVAITKLYQLGRLSKYKIWCFKLSQDCAQWQPSELNTLGGQTVLWFLIIFYYLDCTKCKFPDFSLTFPNIHFFPWPSTKFPDFCQVWNFPDFSLTAWHPDQVWYSSSLAWYVLSWFVSPKQCTRFQVTPHVFCVERQRFATHNGAQVSYQMSRVYLLIWLQGCASPKYWDRASSIFPAWK